MEHTSRQSTTALDMTIIDREKKPVQIADLPANHDGLPQSAVLTAIIRHHCWSFFVSNHFIDQFTKHLIIKHLQVAFDFALFDTMEKTNNCVFRHCVARIIASTAPLDPSRRTSFNQC